MFKKIFVVVMGLMLLGGLVPNGLVHAEKALGTCEIVIDANVHVDNVFAEPTGDCKGHLWGWVTPGDEEPMITGGGTMVVSNGQVVRVNLPIGPYDLKVTVIPKKKADSTPQPKPKEEPKKPSPPNQKPKDEKKSEQPKAEQKPNTNNNSKSTSKVENKGNNQSPASSKPKEASSTQGNQVGGGQQANSKSDELASEKSDTTKKNDDSDKDDVNSDLDTDETEESSDQSLKSSKNENKNGHYVLHAIQDLNSVDDEDEEEMVTTSDESAVKSSNVTTSDPNNDSASKAGIMFAILGLLIVFGGVAYYIYRYRYKV